MILLWATSFLPRSKRYNAHESVIERVSIARENEAGAAGGRKSIFSMLT